MKVQVVHGLAGVRSDVRDHPVTVDPGPGSECRYGLEYLGKDRPIRLGELRGRGDVLLRDDDDVNRGDGVDVAEREDGVRFSDDLRIELLRHDLAEQAVTYRHVDPPISSARSTDQTVVVQQSGRGNESGVLGPQDLGAER